MKNQLQLLNHETQKAWQVLDALEAHVAILDSKGVIIKTNKAWEDFASNNPLQDGSLPANVGIGTNYLQVCLASKGTSEENALLACQGIQDVLVGKRRDFSLEYPCHSPTQQRWFILQVRSLRGSTPKELVVVHTNITRQKLVEIALHQKIAELDAGLANLQVMTTQMREAIALDTPIMPLATQSKWCNATSIQPKSSTIEKSLLKDLSKRDKEILLALVRGERNTDIAARLKLSTKSVSTYRGRVLEKLNAKSNADLVALMMRLNRI
jgi:DNA-binding NarL/FixJ family response regulator